jgi:hypothetical protein
MPSRKTAHRQPITNRNRARRQVIGRAGLRLPTSSSRSVILPDICRAHSAADRAGDLVIGVAAKCAPERRFCAVAAAADAGATEACPHSLLRGARAELQTARDAIADTSGAGQRSTGCCYAVDARKVPLYRQGREDAPREHLA